MNRMQQILFTLLVAAAIPIAAIAVHAQAPPDPGPARPGMQPELPMDGLDDANLEPGGGDFDRDDDGPGGRQSMKEKLNLTDEQQKKLETIRYSHRKKAISMRADLEVAQLDLGRLMRAEPPDGRAINAQIDRLSQLRAGLAKDRVAGMLESREVLTPEQRQQMREMRGAGMRRGWMMRRSMHRGMPGGEGGPHDD
jgi:Spy/CpxP family protein refolding chaperone